MQIYAPRVHRAFQSSVPDILSLSLSLSLALATAVRTFENLHPCLRLFVPICPHCCPQRCKGMIVKKGGENGKLIKRWRAKRKKEGKNPWITSLDNVRTGNKEGSCIFFIFDRTIKREKNRWIDPSYRR